MLRRDESQGDRLGYDTSSRAMFHIEKEVPDAFVNETTDRPHM